MVASHRSQGGKAVYGLSLFQRELAEHVRVPVATSSLLQVPWVQTMLPPGRRVGVLSISGATLTAAHFAAAAAVDTPLAGTENGRELFRVLIKAKSTDLDAALAEQDVIDAGRDLLARRPKVGTLVLACTNMPP